VEDLLYVGRATTQKMHLMGILTIGDCARTDVALLRRRLGKWGEYLWRFANGLDNSPVLVHRQEPPVKSIGNSTTCPRDLATLQDVKIVAFVLAESVAARLKEAHLMGSVISIGVRDIHLHGYTRQIKVQQATNLSEDIAKTALSLFEANIDFSTPLRSIGIKVSDLQVEGLPEQLTLFRDPMAQARALALESTIETIREKYGFNSVQRLIMKEDPLLSSFNPKHDHVIFPESYFKG
jgi:DNA polymerase IV